MSTQPGADRLAYVWARLGARYGESWRRSFGAAPSALAAAEWGEQLAPFDRVAIDAGLVQDAARGSGFPPSSTQLRCLCAGFDPRGREGANPWDPATAPERWRAADRLAHDRYLERFAQFVELLEPVDFNRLQEVGTALAFSHKSTQEDIQHG